MTASSTHPFPRLEPLWPVVLVVAANFIMLRFEVDSGSGAMLVVVGLIGLAIIVDGLVNMVTKAPRPPLQLVHPRMLWWGAAFVVGGLLWRWALDEPHRYLGAGTAGLGVLYTMIGVLALVRTKKAAAAPR